MRARALRPRRARLPGASAAPAGPPRGSGRDFRGALSKEVCWGWLAAAGTGMTLQQQPLTSSPTLLPRGWPTVRPSSPKTTQTELNPTHLAETLPAPQMSKRRLVGPPRLLLPPTPCPLGPPFRAGPGTPSAPRGNLGASGSQPVGPPQGCLPEHPEQREQGTPSAAG